MIRVITSSKRSEKNRQIQALEGVRLPNLSSSVNPDKKYSKLGVNSCHAAPSDEICLKRKATCQNLIPKRDEPKTGLSYLRSPDSGLEDIMEDDSIFIDNNGDMCISVARTPTTRLDSNDNDDSKRDIDEGSVEEDYDEGKGTPSTPSSPSTPNGKIKRRVRFSLPGMGGRCIYPARVEEDRKRYRRYSSPSLFGDNDPPDNDNFGGHKQEGVKKPQRKTSLPPITNYTVEHFYESQVKSVDNLTNSLMPRDSARTTPREDSPSKMTSMGSAHFQAVMNAAFDQEDDDEQRKNSDLNTSLRSLQEDDTPTSPQSPAATSPDTPRPSTPRRRKLGIYQGAPPLLDINTSPTEPLTPRSDPFKRQVSPSSTSPADTSGYNSPEGRSPRSSVSTSPTSKPPTPRLLKRRPFRSDRQPNPTSMLYRRDRDRRLYHRTSPSRAVSRESKKSRRSKGN
ncbi:proteoglycan 4-like isoform X1 [Ptychodera flava]|uniref:proteoglycan 4-like isoform X1 n=1 Tax=Ptychodera flava TaxID=63121 RepID=UPI00396A526B